MLIDAVTPDAVGRMCTESVHATDGAPSPSAAMTVSEPIPDDRYPVVRTVPVRVVVREPPNQPVVLFLHDGFGDSLVRGTVLRYNAKMRLAPASKMMLISPPLGVMGRFDAVSIRAMMRCADVATSAPPVTADDW